MNGDQILALLDGIAPFELAEPWDNVGLLAGSKNAHVDTVLCALDLNAQVIDEARSAGAQLIVTHHPILFKGRKNLAEDDAEGRMLAKLLRSNLSMIAMHTNFDNMHPGVNDALAETLALCEVQGLEHGMCTGIVPEQSFKDYAMTVAGRLGGPVRTYGSPDAPIAKVAVLGGSGGSFVELARMHGADCFITGEIGYHVALNAADEGLCVIEAGHAATEAPGVSLLCRSLQAAANALEYPLTVISSRATLFL